jgi:hypothetical protein
VGAVAELIADRGAGSQSEDFFRSPPFLRAERVTHTLRIEADKVTVAVPVLVREVPGSDLADAISPYGYPGGALSGDGDPPDASEVDWSASGLVSAFVRERIGPGASLGGARERSTVLLHDPSRERSIRERLAEQIRANERRGWEVETLAGPAAGDRDVDDFAAIYEQTMHRARAAPRYFFEAGYFRSILQFERSWLLLARNEGVGAAAIGGLSDRVLHYYLGATADAALGESPFKNVLSAMLDLADELGFPLNLGGGVGAGDGLESFKRGFANAEAAFRTHEIVCAPREYARLAGGREAGSFFPAYRAP